MFTVVLSPRFTYNSKEELIEQIVDYINENPEIIDDVVEDYENPESWTDIALLNFFKEFGGKFMESQHMSELANMLTDAYNECGVEFKEE